MCLPSGRGAAKGGSVDCPPTGAVPPSSLARVVSPVLLGVIASLCLGPFAAGLPRILFIILADSSLVVVSRSALAISGDTLDQLSSPGDLMTVKREASESSNFICLFVPAPCLALSLVPKRESSLKVSSSSGGISSLRPAVGRPAKSTNEARLDALERIASLFFGQKNVTNASSFRLPTVV